MADHEDPGVYETDSSDYEGDDWVPGDPVDSKPFYKRAWFWIAITLLVVCAGLPIACFGALGMMASAGLEIVEEQAGNVLEANPVIQEHIGTELTEVDFLVIESGQVQDESTLVIAVKGAKGEGKVFLDGDGMEAGEARGFLRLPDGEELPLDGSSGD